MPFLNPLIFSECIHKLWNIVVIKQQKVHILANQNAKAMVRDGQPLNIDCPLYTVRVFKTSRVYNQDNVQSK